MRGMPAPLLAALQAANPRPYLAVEVVFDSGAVRLWSGLGTRSIEGQTYTGAGPLLAISTIEEVTDISAKSVSVTLAGIDPALIALALAEPFQRRPARVLQGEMTVSDVLEVFDGQVNVMPIRDSHDSCTIELKLDSKLVTLRRPRTRLLTNEMQIARYPNDTFLSFVTSLVTAEIPFGRD